MREYNGTPILENEGEPITTIKLDHIPEFDIGDYDLTNEKDLFKYFKNIERICRSSRSYKKLVEYLRSCVDMNKCSFFKNVNNIDTYSIKIHIHHTPLTLYDIVTTVYSKRVANHESVTENAVAKEVMFNHYTTCVGLIPLSETVHELVHNGFLFIPTTNVYGAYKDFIERYKVYMDPQLLKTLKEVEEASKAYNFAKETKVLEMHPVYLDVSGEYEFPKVEDIIDMMKKRIQSIDQKCMSAQYYDNNTKR